MYIGYFGNLEIVVDAGTNNTDGGDGYHFKKFAVDTPTYNPLNPDKLHSTYGYANSGLTNYGASVYQGKLQLRDENTDSMYGRYHTYIYHT